MSCHQWCECNRCTTFYDSCMNEIPNPHTGRINGTSDQQLKNELAQRLYDKIKHGDAQHKEWLAKELEEFFKAKVEI